MASHHFFGVNFLMPKVLCIQMSGGLKAESSKTNPSEMFGFFQVSKLLVFL